MATPARSVPRLLPSWRSAGSPSAAPSHDGVGPEHSVTGAVADGVRPRPSGRPGRLARAAVVVALVGVVVTAVAAFAAARIDHNTEQRLLDRQTQQAAAVLSAAIMVIQQPLDSALAVARAAGGTGDRAAFEQFMGPYVGPDKVFGTASLWQRRGKALDRIASVGTQPAMPPDGADTRAHLQRAFDSKTMTVRLTTVGDHVQVVYARADRRTGRLVYAERALPANRRAPVDNDSAFHDMHYAIYLGKVANADTLSTTDVDPATLPLDGITSSTTVPFGDTVLTLTMTPRDHLGSGLGRRLPWLILVAGLLLTAIATRAGQQLARGRQTAESDASTITALYQRTETLFGQQRELFVSLQRALLPPVIPEIPNVELAAEYVAGARGVDIGGDWYSTMDAGDGRFAFVVGDVSGRGVDAVAVMAQARFTVRAYLLDGNDPATALEKCASQFDILVDGHLTTVLVGVGDWRTGEITLASAGHPPPLLLTEAGASYVEVMPGRPLGTGVASYPTATFTMPAGSTLFCYTDGLVERRDEDIDTGLGRLAEVLTGMAHRPVEDLVSHALERLRRDDTADDIAALALRWVGPR